MLFICGCLCCVYYCCCFFFFKQKTAYEMRISDWSSDVCSSDLGRGIVILADRHGADARDVDEGQAALFRPGIELLLNFLAVALRSRVLGDLHAGVAQAEDHVARRDPAVAAEEADQILPGIATEPAADRKSTRLNSSHSCASRMPS